MRARPMYVVALLLALAGLGAYLYVPAVIGRQHRAALGEARRLQAALPAPPGARVLAQKDCHSDVPRRCFRMPGEVRAVADRLAGVLGEVAGAQPRRSCDRHVSPLGTEYRSCILRVETGRGHAVMVFVETLVEVKRRDGRVVETVRGTAVDYTAV